MKTTALLPSLDRAAAPSLEFKELKDYKEEKDDKEDKQAQHLNHKPFTKLGSDSHRQVLSFLSKKESLQTRQVSRAFNIVGQSSSWTDSTGQSSMWKESEKKLKQDLTKVLFDRRFLGCLQSIHEKSNLMGREVNAFVVQCYENFGERYAVLADKKEVAAKSQQGIPDVYYKLLETIISHDVAEFLRITDAPGFNVNYFIGFLSPLLLAELFPHPQILEKLKSLDAQLLPMIFLRETNHYFYNSERNYLHMRQMYFSQSITAMKVAPVLVNVIAKYTTDGDADALVRLGIMENKPFAKAIAYMSDYEGVAYSNGMLLHYWENLKIFNLQLGVIGNHSKETLTVLLKRGVDSVFFSKNPAKKSTTENLLHGFHTFKLAASLSVHIFKCYLEVYPAFFNGFFANTPPAIPALINEGANLDCVGELVRQFPNDKSLPALAVRRIIMNIRHDSNASRGYLLVFHSDEERRASVAKDLRSLVLPNAEEFFTKEWIALAVKHDCHEFLQAISDVEHLAEEKATRISMTDFLFDASNQDTDSSKKRAEPINMTHFLFDALNQDAGPLTIQVLLGFKNIDVNAYDAGKKTPVIIALEKLHAAISEGYLRLLAIAEVLVQHPRVRLHFQDADGRDGLDHICNQGYASDVKKLLSYERFTLHDVERLLLKRSWVHNATVMEVLLPYIKPYSNQSFLIKLFDQVWRHFSYADDEFFMLLNRADLLPLGENCSLENLRYFVRLRSTSQILHTIFHPHFDMKYFQNKEIMDKKLLTKSPETYNILRCRHKVYLAEAALKVGKMDEADKNFKKARSCDPLLVDVYLKQVIEKFPGEYHFTEEQRAMLFSSPGILQSTDVSILILLAQENLKSHPILTEVLCERALQFHLRDEDRAGLAKMKNALAVQLDLVHASRPVHDAREKLLAIAKNKTKEREHLVFDGKHKLVALEVVSTLEHGYDKWVERRCLLNMCIKLVDKGVSIRDPFFAALLSAVEHTMVPALKSKPSLNRL